MSFDSDFLLWVLAAVAGLSVLTLTFAFVGDEASAKRMKRVSGRVRGKPAEEQASEMLLRLDPGRNTGLDAFVRRYLPQPDLLRERLQRTGWSIGLGIYALANLGSVIACVTLMLVVGLSAPIGIPAGMILGLLLPHLVISFALNRRATKFTKLFPEAIGLMVRGIKSGLPIAETFLVVGQEVPDPVGEEFRRVSDQVRLGQSLDQALWDSARRIGTAEIKFLVVSMSVQKETGGNLAETLENLDDVLRKRRQMKLKVKAMSSEARASAAIIGALPFIMLGVLSGVNQAYIARLFETHLGNLMLAGGGFSMALGVFIMQKMARFEI